MNPADIPSISAGALGGVLECGFRFASRLRGDGAGIRRSDPAMRLWSELHKSLRAGHEHAWDQSLPLDEAMDNMRLNVAPDDLSVEESEIFRQVLDSYVDAFGAEAMAPHAQSGQPLRRRVPTKPPFDLTGRADLLFAFADSAPGSNEARPERAPGSNEARPDSAPLVRRISLRGSGRDVAKGASVSDLALAVLLKLDTRPGETDVLLRSETLWFARDGQVSSQQITKSELAEFRVHLLQAADNAIQSSELNPSWWCSSCELLAICPSVPSEPTAVLLERLRRTRAGFEPLEAHA